MSETPQNPPSHSLKGGIDWVAKHWPRVRLAHEGLMVDKIQRQNRIVETTAKNSMTGDTTNTDGWPGSDEDDAMGVKIGDEVVHNHYPQPPPAEPPPAEPSSFPWMPMAAAAAIGAATFFGLKSFDKDPPPEPTPPPAVEQPDVTHPDAYYRPKYMRHGVGVDPPSE